MRTPFGYCNSPAVFQRFINEVFRPLMEAGIVAVYLDDVVVLAKDPDEALHRLKRVLDQSASYGELQVNWKKCQFMSSQITYLGYEISDGEVRPNSNLYTELHTHASRTGMGAILLQRSTDGKMHPVYYYSKMTNKAQQNYNSYELEILAVISALKKFRFYLLGIKFKIITDCSTFEQTMKKKELSTRIARWALLFEDFDYELAHRKGSAMRHADALSRDPVMVINDGTLARIQQAQNRDPEVEALKRKVREQETQDFTIVNGISYKNAEGKDLLYVPKGLQTELIRQVHVAGHFAITKTKQIFIREYWAPKLEKKNEQVISCCVLCILAATKTGKRVSYTPLIKTLARYILCIWII